MGVPGAEFAHEKHSLIPPSLAPHRWQLGIANLLSRFPFETNVFCMTRFPKRDGEGEEPDPNQGVIDIMRDVIQKHGMHLHLASDRQADDDLFGNVGAHMWACKYGIGLLENRGSSNGELNDKVLIELGSMLVMGRRCAILKDKGAPRPPSDLSGQIYKSVDFTDRPQTAAAVHRWLTDDLGLPRCSECPEPVGAVAIES